MELGRINTEHAAITHSKTSSFLKFPNELIEAIEKETDNHWNESIAKHDIMALRLTCRTLNVATRPAFARRYFWSRKVVLERGRLRQLKEIGKIPYLANATTSVQFWCAEVYKTSQKILDSIITVDPRYAQEAQSALFIGLAIGSFPNLKRMRFSNSHYDLQSNHETMPKLHQNETRLLSAALRAAEACDIAIDDICLDLDLTDDVLLLSGKFVVLQSSPSCSSLSALSLTIPQLPSEHKAPHSFKTSAFGKHPAISLNHFPSLKSLWLNFSGFSQHSTDSGVWRGFAAYLDLPQLSAIDMYSIDCSLSALLDVFRKHAQTLVSINIMSVKLRGTVDENTLRTFFANLRDGMHLEKFRLSLLRHRGPGNYVGFPRVAKRFPDPLPELGSFCMKSRNEVKEGLPILVDNFILGLKDPFHLDESEEEAVETQPDDIVKVDVDVATSVKEGGSQGESSQSSQSQVSAVDSGLSHIEEDEVVKWLSIKFAKLDLQ